jgi:hypothetical protein
MQVLKTPVIHAHVAERLDSTNKQNAPTRVYMYTHTRAYINAYAYIYTDIHIYIYMHIVIWVFGCWVNIPHTHTSERDYLLFESCSHPTVTVTPSDLNYANRSNSLQRFGSIHTSTIASMILRIRTTGACAPGSRRMILLKTVATWLNRYFAGSQGGGAKKRPGNGDK